MRLRRPNGWDFRFARLAGVRILWRAPLARYTTFRLGGPCRALIFCGDPGVATTVVRELAERGEPFVVLGEGSNVLVSDAGYDGFVIRYFRGRPWWRLEGDHAVIWASSRLEDTSRETAARGWRGLERAAGIPGTVGGAVAGNAGTRDWAMGDALVWARLLGRDGTERIVPGPEMDFAYRHSRVRDTGEVVLEVALRLASGKAGELEGVRRETLRERRVRLPDWRRLPCAGCFFRNPGGESTAGQLLEQAGAARLARGGARVYEKHANVIVRASRNCRAQDVYDLAVEMARRVREKFGVQLVPEVRLLGKFEGERLALDR